MTKKLSPSDRTRLSTAVLQLAATSGWARMTLAAVAKEAKISLVLLKKHFPTLYERVGLSAEEIDREAFVGLSKISESPHEALFDILMARFDILQKNRKGILNMAQAARQDRALSCALARAAMDGVYRILDKAHLNRAPRALLAASLFAIYSWTFFIWSKDTSRDMAKTMAALDRALRWAQKASSLAPHRL